MRTLRPSGPLAPTLTLALVLALPGCSGSGDPLVGDTATTEMSTDASTATSTTTATSLGDASTAETSTTETSTGETLAPVLLDRALIERLAGDWSGPVVMSPWGTIPDFPVDLQWSGDDVLASDTPIPDSDGYFRFRFEHAGGGAWSLTEEGKLPGGPTQSYTLDPVELDGDTSRWVYLADPDLLTVLITVTDDSLTLDTRLHGETHAVFQLTR